MSKLISEEIVEAVTLGDKEGFMSAFHSALAAKVSDALEIKKVEIASTLIAPASSEVVEEAKNMEEDDEDDSEEGMRRRARRDGRGPVEDDGDDSEEEMRRRARRDGRGPVEEEVEQIDEAADYTLKHVGTSHPKDVTDDEDQPVKATEKSYEIHKGGKKVGELEHHHNEYGGHFYSGNLHGRKFPWARNNNSLGGKNDAHSYLASALKSKWHTSKHSATNEEVEQIDELSKNTLSSYVGKAYWDQGKRMAHGAEVYGYVAGKYGRKATRGEVFKNAKEMHRDKTRDTGVERALSRLAKEEVEQIDELKKSTLASYIRKGAVSLRKPNMDIARGTDVNKNIAKVNKREIGMAAAAKKLAKEEVEQVDEGTPEAKGQSRAEWRMGTADVIAKNNAKIAAKKAKLKKKLLGKEGK